MIKQTNLADRGSRGPTTSELCRVKIAVFVKGVWWLKKKIDGCRSINVRQ